MRKFPHLLPHIILHVQKAQTALFNDLILINTKRHSLTLFYTVQVKRFSWFFLFIVKHIYFTVNNRFLIQTKICRQASMIGLKKTHPAVLIASEAASARCRVRMTEGEAHPAAVWLLAFRRVPPGRRSAVGLPLGLRARGCAQGQDQQHSITRQRHPFAITIREAPLGWCEGWVGGEEGEKGGYL